MISAVVVALGSVPVIWFSRRSLLRPASHGFSRFFAFEAILALVVVNVPHWFVEPFGTQQVAEFRHVPDWRQVDPGCIDRAPDGFGSALSFFSAAAFRYYQHRAAEPADA